MTDRVRVGIAGTGAFVPDRIVTNDDLAEIVDTSDQWISQRTGIRERRFVSDGENTSDLSHEAARRALEAASFSADRLDLIVVGTLTPDYLLPSTACLVQHKLGAKNAGAFDVAAACTGFLAALHTAESFIAAGRAKRVLAIGAETMSRFLNMEDRTSCVIFGDGAGAAVVTPLEESGQGEILEVHLGADGSGSDFIQIPAGGAARPHNHPDYRPKDNFLRLRGKEVYRFAVAKMTGLITKITEGIDPEEVAVVVPHQVNRRIIDAAVERLGWSEERFIVNIDRYGNTSAASVPLALDEAVRDGRIQRGQLVVLVAFGAGLAWGATLLRW